MNKRLTLGDNRLKRKLYKQNQHGKTKEIYYSKRLG